MASLGGSGSSSNNFSTGNGSFNQDVWKTQAPYLQDLYKTAGQTYQGSAPFVSNQAGFSEQGQNATAGLSQAGLQNLLQGGAYAGMTGASIAPGIQSQMATLNPINSQQYGLQAGPGTIGTQQMNLPGYYNGSNLPQAISTQQSSLLNQLNPMASIGNQKLDQAQLVNNNSQSGPTNAQQVYQQIMGGKGNSYADALAGTLQTQANVAQNNALNNIDQRAAGAGMSGSSRQGVAQANAIKDINQNLQSNLSQIGYDTFNQDLNNKLNIAEMADTNATNRYLGNQNYNLGLVNAGNTMASNAQGYNLGLGGLGNANNQQNLNYNLGLGQNTIGSNTANQNYNLGYGQNVNTNNAQNLNYNLGLNQNNTQANANIMNANNASQANQQNYNLGLAGNNTALQSLLGGLVAGNQNSQVAGMQASPLVSQNYGAGIQSVMAPFQALNSYADALGGPVVLGSGKYSSMGTGSSKGGGGGVSVGSVGGG